jgi:hypothetical protein
VSIEKVGVIPEGYERTIPTWLLIGAKAHPVAVLWITNVVELVFCIPLE